MAKSVKSKHITEEIQDKTPELLEKYLLAYIKQTYQTSEEYALWLIKKYHFSCRILEWKNQKFLSIFQKNKLLLQKQL